MNWNCDLEWRRLQAAAAPFTPSTNAPANACIGRFAVDDVQYEFKAYFYYTVDETTVKVWDIKLTIQDRPDEL